MQPKEDVPTLLQVVDAAVLGFFTNISHQFQRLTGRTNFFLAKCAFFLVFVAEGMRSFNTFVRFAPERLNFLSPLAPVMSVVVLCLAGMIIYYCDQAEGQTWKSGQTQAATPLRMLYTDKLRRLLLAFVPLFVLSTVADLTGSSGPKLFYELTIDLGYYAYGAMLYLVAVDPLPPAKSKVQEWQEAFRAAFRQLSLSGNR